MSRRHYLQYIIADLSEPESRREAARRELAAGVVQTQPTVAEWIGPRIVLAKRSHADDSSAT